MYCGNMSNININLCCLKEKSISIFNKDDKISNKVCVDNDKIKKILIGCSKF